MKRILILPEISEFFLKASNLERLAKRGLVIDNWAR
jgi:hypothetical protein